MLDPKITTGSTLSFLLSPLRPKEMHGLALILYITYIHSVLHYTAHNSTQCRMLAEGPTRPQNEASKVSPVEDERGRRRRRRTQQILFCWHRLYFGVSGHFLLPLSFYCLLTVLCFATHQPASSYQMKSDRDAVHYIWTAK